MSDGTEFPEYLSRIYHSLSATRRRYVIKVLSEVEDEPVPVRTLASEIVALEEEIEPEQATGRAYRNVYNALVQTHLSTLAEIAIITYEPNRKKVSSGPLFDMVALVIDSNDVIYHHLGDDTFPGSVRNEEGSTTD